MEKHIGRIVSGGIATGEIYYYKQCAINIGGAPAQHADMELARYEQARKRAMERLNSLALSVRLQVGEENAQIFEMQAMMLDDDDYNDYVRENITGQNISAEAAVNAAREYFAGTFAAMDDEYFKARANDIEDISGQVIAILCGEQKEIVLNRPVIIAADDLTPSETVQMDKRMVLAFITRQGSQLSHTAILARAMNIPALVGVDLKDEWDGKQAVVDGYTGELYISPDEATKRQYLNKSNEEAEKQALLRQLKGQDNVTKGGRRIDIYANIGDISDLPAVIDNDAGGIGLFRSEFLYLKRDEMPTEQELFEAYKGVAEAMDGKRVIVRTLDIGADKTAGYFHLEHEENPALGYRGIRLCLGRPELFKTQLRAIYRASAYGNIAIMYPMIISVDEIAGIKEIVKEVELELKKEGAVFGRMEHGIMVETPAAAIISDKLAREVDFFSIGTNDLSQYTLAIDRQNSKLDSFYNPYHEAILRLIRMVVDNAHENGIWVGICGELGADLSLTKQFVEMGVDELSVAPAMVLPLRKTVREM